MKTYNFVIKGMVCESCEKIIKKELLKKEDISDIKINFKTGKCIINLKEHSTLTFRDISKIIESQGYTCSEKNNNLGWIFGALGLIIVGYFLLKFIGGVNIPDITKNMSYSLLFLVGLLTGFHCIAMCGGFVLSYTTKNAQMDKKNHLSHIFYGSGKLISYTLIGALFGLIGSLITFTPLIRGTAGIIAGLFLLIFGLKMLNIIPSLNWFSIKTPRETQEPVTSLTALFKSLASIFGSLLFAIPITCSIATLPTLILPASPDAFSNLSSFLISSATGGENT